MKSSQLHTVSVLLVYPNTTKVALSNLGFQQVYALLNRIEGVVCDRYSLPDDWTPGRPKPSNLRSNDSGKLPGEFDIIAFSISFEPDYLQVATLLNYFHIPLERTARGRRHPLILAGGSAVFINPEPLADICDLLCIGEAETMVDKLFGLYRCGGWDHPRDLLTQAAGVQGVYAPEFYHPEYQKGRQVALRADPAVPSRVARYFESSPAEDRKSHGTADWTPELCTHSSIHNGVSTFGDMALMEVTRGCIWACRFCTAGFIYRPPRLPDLEKTYASLSAVLSEQGGAVSTIGLVGPSVTDHPDLLRLARKIVAEGKKLSFSSLRMETLTDELVDLILKSGQKTITVAIDGPSERMRDVINKAATDAFIIDKCRFLTEKGILHLKIYSIVGLPEENDDDIDQFICLIEKISKTYVEACRRRGNIGHLTISLSPLVPKPGTPFQWHPMERVDLLKKRFMKVRKALGRLPHVKLSFGSPNEAYLQTYLSRGDRRLMYFFQEYLANGHDIKNALKTCQLAASEKVPHPDDFVYRQYEKNDFLPWDIIDHGYKNNFLWQDYQRGLRGKHTPICDTSTCKICGIC